MLLRDEFHINCGRDGFLRARVQAVRRYRKWLAINHDTDYPTDLVHVTDYLQGRQLEPSSRAALKGPHSAFVFMKEVAGVTLSARFSSNPLYTVIPKELVTDTVPGTIPQDFRLVALRINSGTHSGSATIVG